MTATRAKQTDRVWKSHSGRSHSGWIVRPLDLSVFGLDNCTAIDRIVLSAICTFSTAEEFCRFTYRDLRDRYRCSVSSIYRSIRKGLSGNVKRGEQKKLYSVDAPAGWDAEKFVLIDEWLYFAEFICDQTPVQLYNTEVEILSLLRYYHKKHWYTSQNRIADQLNIASSTVSSAINRFVKIKIVTKEYEKGCTVDDHQSLVFYRVNEALLAQKRRQVVVRERARKADAPEGDWIQRERYYSDLKQREEARIADLEKKLGADFAELKKKLRVFGMEIAKAEYSGDEETAKILRERSAKIHAALREKLEQMGLTEQDLEPRHVCPDCGDTGVLADGSFCDCWRRRS